MKTEEQMEKLARYGSRMKRIRFWDLLEGVTAAEFFVLAALAESGREALTVSGIQEKTKMHQTVVSRLMNGLEERGLIVRNIRKSNRRVTDVSVTGEGRIIYQKNKAIFRRYWEDVLAGVPGEDIDRLLLIWDGLISRMESVFAERKINKKEGNA